MDILRCSPSICNKLHVLNKLARLLTRANRHNHVYAFKNTYPVQSMEWGYVHTCSFIYHSGKIHRITPFQSRFLIDLPTLCDRSNKLRPHWVYLASQYHHSSIASYPLRLSREHLEDQLCHLHHSNLDNNTITPSETKQRSIQQHHWDI